MNIRAYSDDPHRHVDDRPYGGGPGMVLMAKPVTAAIRDVKTAGAKVILLSAQGKLFDAAKARELANETHLVFVCGHYEGVDERVHREIDEELSI